MNRVAVIAVMLVAGVVHAQPNRVISGVVTTDALEEDHARPIAGAVIVGERGSTAATDDDGKFTIEIALNELELTVTAKGFAPRAVRLGESSTLVIRLGPAAGSEVIQVSGRAPEQPKPKLEDTPLQQTKPTSYQLTSQNIRELPGTGNDALRAAQMLPGVARMPFSFGGLVLRGTSPRDSVVMLDGIEVPLAFHFGGVTSFYPSSMLTDLTLTAGGFDASHGRAQGGIVTLTSREPRRDKWRKGGSVGLLDSSATAEGPAGSGAVLIGVRRSYFDIVAAAWAPDDVPLPSYLDAQIRGSFGDPNLRGRYSPILFVSLDQVSMTSPSRDMSSEDETDVLTTFVRIGMPYYRQWGARSLRIVPWLGANKLQFRSVTNSIVEKFQRPAYRAGLRTDLMRDTSWGHLRGGLDGEAGHLTNFQSGLGHKGDIIKQVNGETTIDWLDVGLWGEARVKLDGDRFALKPGLRLEHYGLTGEWVIDPRLNIHQRLSDSVTFRQSIGRYHQPPTPGDMDKNGGNPRLKSSYMDQMSLGVDTTPEPGWTAAATSFFSYGQNIGVRTEAAMGGFANLGALGPTFELLLEKQLGLAFYREPLGRARSYGVELLVKREIAPYFAMLAYTIQVAERTDDPRLPGMVDGLALGWRPYELDQRHNINVVVAKQFTKWRLGARAQLVSGTPYTPMPSFANPMPVQYSATLPWFVRFDVRADRRWPQCWGDVALYIDIQNVTNTRNVEGRGFDNETPPAYRDVLGLPIVPFIGIEFVPN